MYSTVGQGDYCAMFLPPIIVTFNPSSPKGGCNNPQTVFTLVLKIAQPRGKIASGTFQVHPFPSF